MKIIYKTSVLLVLILLSAVFFSCTKADSSPQPVEETDYIITFDSNDGTPVTEIIGRADTAISAPTPPERDGFTFGGWYTDDETFNNPYTFTVMPGANITLYAKWTANSLGGTVSVPYSVKISQDNIPDGAKLVVSVFCGYNLLSRHTEPVPDLETVSGEIVVNALLTDTLTVEVSLLDAEDNSLSAPVKWQYRGTETSAEDPTPAQIIDAYITAFSQLYDKGLEYGESGMPFQSSYALSWAAAAVSSMRLSIEHTLSITASNYFEESEAAGLPVNYEKIAAFNYACPYPSFFYGWRYEFLFMSNELPEFYEEAQFRYGYASANPDFVPLLDNELKNMADMTEEELLAARTKLLQLEEAIFEVFTPPIYEDVVDQEIQRFDPAYWRQKGLDCLEEPNIYGEYEYDEALKFFKGALAVNPFQGENFALCALAYFYLGDYEQMAFYVNHGLYADPDHEGLNAMFDLMKAREEEEW